MQGNATISQSIWRLVGSGTLGLLSIYCPGQSTPKSTHVTLPIPVECMAGNNAFALQTQINKYITPPQPIQLFIHYQCDIFLPE